MPKTVDLTKKDVLRKIRAVRDMAWDNDDYETTLALDVAHAAVEQTVSEDLRHWEFNLKMTRS